MNEMNLKHELLSLPTEIKNESSKIEETYRKLKLKELQLGFLKSKEFLRLKGNGIKEVQAVTEARLEKKFYRKYRNLRKLYLQYRADGIQLEHLKNTFSALKKVVLLEVVGNGYTNQ